MSHRHHGHSAPAFLAWLLACTATASAGQVINVEVDWLKAGGHTHEPAACELDAVVAAFDRNGVTLNIEMSDEITETAALTQIDFISPNEFDNGEWAALEAANRDHAAGTGWHYMLFGHDYSYDGVYTGSSGLAEIFGDEFLVSLGSFDGGIGTPWDRSGTFMHEFGHNLGLRHAGDQDENVVRQFKPNYMSVMTYRYQLIGVRNGVECQELATLPVPFFNLDYSHGNCTLEIDESRLFEPDGIGYGGVDWNCDGDSDDNAAEDVSSATDWCPAAGYKTVLKDYDDWGNILSVADTDADYAPQVVTCMTVHERLALLEATDSLCIQVDPCERDTGFLCGECFLVIGDNPGDAPFQGGEHVFSTQLDQVQDAYAVLMDDIPEFVMPGPGLWAVPTATMAGGAPGRGNTASWSTAVPEWMWDGVFTVQILLWNPVVFPQLPEQHSYGLHVVVTAGGGVVSVPYGSGTGITVWPETDVNAQGEPVVRFPFLIPGN